MPEIAVIAPTSAMVRIGKGRRYHLLLAHLAKDRAYIQAVHEMKGYKILDNSLMENGHRSMTMQDVIRAAHILQPDEIVLPDVFMHGQDTVNSVEAALSYCARVGARKHYQVAAVAHGRTPEEWYACYKDLVTLGVDVIHIPKVMDTLWYGGRAGLIHWLNHSTSRARYLEHHLLGIWTTPMEMLAYTHIPWLRSCDTALPVQAALQGVSLSPRFGLDAQAPKPKRPVGYFETKMTHEQEILADENIRILDNMAKGLDVT